MGGTTIFTMQVAFYAIHTAHTTVPELYPHLGFEDCSSSSEDHTNPNRGPHAAARRSISATVLTFWRFMDSSCCVLIEILTRVHVCDCSADNGPFQQHYFNQREYPLMMAPMGCRNMQKEILCIRCIYNNLYTNSLHIIQWKDPKRNWRWIMYVYK